MASVCDPKAKHVLYEAFVLDSQEGQREGRYGLVLLRKQCPPLFYRVYIGWGFFGESEKLIGDATLAPNCSSGGLRDSTEGRTLSSEGAAMSTKLLQHFESIIKLEEQAFQATHLSKQPSELRGACETRSIVRHLRTLEGIPICCGDGHCLEFPKVLCTRGQHVTCSAHKSDCYLCDRLMQFDS